MEDGKGSINDSTDRLKEVLDKINVSSNGRINHNIEGIKKENMNTEMFFKISLEYLLVHRDALIAENMVALTNQEKAVYDKTHFKTIADEIQKLCHKYLKADIETFKHGEKKKIDNRIPDVIFKLEGLFSTLTSSHNLLPLSPQDVLVAISETLNILKGSS